VIIWADGEVTEVRARWPGAVELTASRSDTDGTVRALAYTDLTPTPAVGDRVLLNVAALDHGLGTGGYAVVVAVLDQDGRVAAQPPQPAGHLVKARYLPLQAMVAGADEQGSPHHELLRDADSLAGLLAGSVTVGQAFGGDLEAVTVHSGLLAARLALAADLVVLTQGPGNLGTGTRWGFSGVAAGEAVNAAAVLGGRPVGSLRVSAADPRERHRGVSHHSLTAYARVALMRCDIALPDFGAEPGLEGLVEPVAQAAALLERRHDLIPVDLTGLVSLLVESPIRLSSMGRGVRDDPGYFLAAAAAGRHAADLLSPTAPPG